MAAHQAPLSLEFSRWNTRVGCHFRLQKLYEVVLLKAICILVIAKKKKKKKRTSDDDVDEYLKFPWAQNSFLFLWYQSLKKKKKVRNGVWNEQLLQPHTPPVWKGIFGLKNS